MTHIVQIPKVFDHDKGLPIPKIDFDDDTVKIGSRKSVLAVRQSDIVAETITKAYPHLKTTIAKVSTLGDQVQNRPLYSFGGKALWTKELEILLLEDVGEYKQIDLIAHSLKDMPTILPDDFELGCIISREGMYSNWKFFFLLSLFYWLIFLHFNYSYCFLLLF